MFEINKSLRFQCHKTHKFNIISLLLVTVFNINNPQDLNNMVWMNNSNSGLPQISSVTGGGQNQMILDENSITYFNTQQTGQANLSQQQQAALMVRTKEMNLKMHEFKIVINIFRK
jgi:hypothetical protein